MPCQTVQPDAADKVDSDYAGAGSSTDGRIRGAVNLARFAHRWVRSANSCCRAYPALGSFREFLLSRLPGAGSFGEFWLPRLPRSGFVPRVFIVVPRFLIPTVARHRMSFSVHSSHLAQLPWMAFLLGPDLPLQAARPQPYGPTLYFTCRMPIGPERVT